MARVKGIFCLEGDWQGNLARPWSVEPILELLKKSPVSPVPSIHRDVETLDALEHYLGRWAQKGYRKYPILYLAFHGRSGLVCLRNSQRASDEVTLDQLEELLAGRCHKRLIHFGCCETLNVNGHRLNRFLRSTGALALCGFTDYIDWLHSTAFDLLLFAAMQANAFTVSGARAIKARIKRDMPHQARALKFRMVIRKAGW